MDAAEVDVDTMRGYGHPDVHSNLQGCQTLAHRHQAHKFVSPDVDVGAIRISATGWEGWVLEGLKVSHSAVSQCTSECRQHGDNLMSYGRMKITWE